MFKHCSGLFMATLLMLAPLVQAQPERYLVGRDYTLVDAPSTDRTPETVAVVEYFWYGCPGCYQFDPLIENWKMKLTSNVAFSRLPVLWSDWHEVHAKAYYTAAQLDLLESLHPALFHAMHRENKPLRNETELQDFFVAQGVAVEDFTQTYNSFGVTSSINRARNLAREYGLRSAPSLVVNGKYLVAASNEALEVVDFLIAKELAGN